MTANFQWPYSSKDYLLYRASTFKDRVLSCAVNIQRPYTWMTVQFLGPFTYNDRLNWWTLFFTSLRFKFDLSNLHVFSHQRRLSTQRLRKLAKMDDLTAMIMMWNEDLMKFLNHSPESLDSSIFIILKQLCCLLIKMQKEFIPNHDFISLLPSSPTLSAITQTSVAVRTIRAMWTNI